MSITKEQIIEEISKMSLIEINEFISMIETKFNIKNDLYKENQDTNNDKLKIKDEFNIILKSIGENKISVIKVIRSILNLDLKESKKLVESCPVTLKEKLKESEINNIKELLENAGATIEIQ
ncbi:50S ribosomal protein L7/L12 [endosymbiont of Pachyrhynchus infernalis]|uniref:50S ribosomal protein L7/L12 n=1 Tax=endosymbiont of Pachyrhynchus infernalis TaxID=1971488 RepID=UPI000DC6D8C7|nr:50S ribosomal protein L7/L12 [endosymbiont of Pachyrhynchus infernalis]BBA84825.1 50S ribosomal protein L7/L12 [endosymbiont of Pachyrhynchus infernalis]